MMRKNKWLFVATFLLLIILLKVFFNSTVFNWMGTSKDVLESKEIGAFVQDYNLDSIFYFKNKDETNLQFLSSISIWKEKEWHTKPWVIFFHPIQFTGKEILVIKSADLGLNRYNRLLFVKFHGDNQGGEIKNNDLVVLRPEAGFVEDKVELLFYFSKNEEVAIASFIAEK